MKDILAAVALPIFLMFVAVPIFAVWIAFVCSFIGNCIEEFDCLFSHTKRRLGIGFDKRVYEYLGDGKRLLSPYAKNEEETK